MGRRQEERRCLTIYKTQGWVGEGGGGGGGQHDCISMLKYLLNKDTRMGEGVGFVFQLFLASIDNQMYVNICQVPFSEDSRPF